MMATSLPPQYGPSCGRSLRLKTCGNACIGSSGLNMSKTSERNDGGGRYSVSSGGALRR